MKCSCFCNIRASGSVGQHDIVGAGEQKYNAMNMLQLKEEGKGKV